MGVPVPILDPATAFRQALAVSLPSHEAIKRAVATIPRACPPKVSRFGRRYEAPRWFLTVSPGTVRISVKTMSPKEPAWDNDAMVETAESDQTTRGRISDFSRKSRARMTDVFRSLDYTPMFAKGDIPALVTLTAPHDWEAIFPTPEDFARARQRFFDAYRAAWGEELVAVWKIEFQDRKACRENGCHDPRAPHIHMLMTPPRGVSRGRGARKDRNFRQWLSLAWAEVACGGANVGVQLLGGKGYEDFVSAGTNVDWREGQRYSDPKRIAVYFDKHSGYHEKDYQNEWPELWKNAVGDGAAGTNVWGYTRGLKKITETIELSRGMGSSSRSRGFDALQDEPRRAWQAQPRDVSPEVEGIMSSNLRHVRIGREKRLLR